MGCFLAKSRIILSESTADLIKCKLHFCSLKYDRRNQEQRHLYKTSTSTYTPRNFRDTQGDNSNDTMQSVLRDYQQPEGRFSNGTYIPHVTSTPSSDHATDNTLRIQSSGVNTDSIVTRRSPSLSTSLSGIGLPYQIPRPSVANNSSSSTFANSSHVSPVTHYYNDPYGEYTK